MMKKILLSVSLSVLLFNKINAQKNCNVEMLDTEKKETETVCFKRDTFPNSDYTTKYVFLLDGSEIYEVNFSYYKGKNCKDSSYFKIFFINKPTGVSGTKYIKFKNGSSYYIIKNFTANDTEINYEDYSYSILFSVPNEDEPYVTLNKFLSFEDEKKRFKLAPVDPTVLADHKLKTKNYFEMEYRDSVNKAKHNALVTSLKNDMVNYKDSVIRNIEKKEEISKGLPATRTPDDKTLNSDFKVKLDSVFIPYLKKLYLFNDSDMDATFTFSCDGFHKINTQKTTINSNNGKPINWFTDTFNFKLQPAIATQNFETITEVQTHANMQSELINQFRDKMDKLNLAGDCWRVEDQFKETVNNIDIAFNQYSTRLVNVPTKYIYTIKYKSEVKETTWKLLGDGSVKPKGDKLEKIPRSLELLFKKRLADSGQGTGKYDIKICTLYINNEQMGQDIQLLPKKETPNY